MTTIQQVVGQRIREAREAMEWTQVQVGRELEALLGQAWSSQVMAQAEAGERAFTAAEMVALAIVLEREVGWFFRPRIGEAEYVEIPRRRRVPREQGGGFEDLSPTVVPWWVIAVVAGDSDMDAEMDQLQSKLDIAKFSRSARVEAKEGGRWTWRQTLTDAVAEAEAEVYHADAVAEYAEKAEQAAPEPKEPAGEETDDGVG